MEDGFRGDFIAPESDRGAESPPPPPESRSESTLANSLESGVTVESSRCYSCGSSGDADTRPDECSGWTNEKHNSYLDYLEKSFVKELYCLMGKTRRSFRTHDLPANSYKSTDQFAVLQNGYRQKVKIGTKRTHLDTSSDFHHNETTLRSHFADRSGSYTGETAIQGNLLCNEETNHSGDKALSGTSLRNPAGLECSTESTAEASGQNFADEDKAHSTVSKRRKMDAKPESSKNDQVVPVGTVKQSGVSGGRQFEGVEA